jgi:hypothetical protein
VKQNKKVARATVEDPIVDPAVVATKLSKRSIELRCMGKWEGRLSRSKVIETVDLEINGQPFLRGGSDLAFTPLWIPCDQGEFTIEELQDGFRAVRVAVVDGLCPGDAGLSRQDQKLSPP